jgi:hypothetical protein
MGLKNIFSKIILLTDSDGEWLGPNFEWHQPTEERVIFFLSARNQAQDFMHVKQVFSYSAAFPASQILRTMD